MANRARKKRSPRTRAKGWKKAIQAHDEQVRQSTAATRKREKPYASRGVDPEAVVAAKPPRRPLKRRYATAGQAALWRSLPAWLHNRDRGVAGNTAGRSGVR